MLLSVRAPLLLLCAALAVSGVANPRQLEAVRRFLHRSHDRGAVPPPRRLHTFTEPRRQAPSPGFDCPAQFGLFPDPYDCSSYFQCSYGNAFVEHCQPGLQFNPKTLSCDWPANIDPPCQEIPYPSTGAPVLQEQEQEQEAVKSQSADPLPTPTPSPWFDCPAQFGVFPDPYNCNSYFQCSYGIPFEEHCQPGLQFNPISGTCDWPANIHPPCQEIPYPSTGAPVLQEQEQEAMKSKSIDSSAPAPSPWFDCPAQFGLLPDPYDCSSYFQCSYGNAFVEHCQPGLQFNPKTLSCDWPANIDPPCQEIPYPSTGAPPLQESASRS